MIIVNVFQAMPKCYKCAIIAGNWKNFVRTLEWFNVFEMVKIFKIVRQSGIRR